MSAVRKKCGADWSDSTIRRPVMRRMLLSGISSISWSGPA